MSEAAATNETGLVRRAMEYDLPNMVALAREFHAKSNQRFLKFSESQSILMGTRCINEGFARVVGKPDALRGMMIGVAGPTPYSLDLVAVEIVLIVEETARGGVLGDRLVKAFSDWALSKRCKAIIAGQTAGVCPKETRKLYVSNGFEVVGEAFLKRII